MELRTQLYINGDWVATPKTFAVHNPADGALLANVASAEASHVTRAIDAAHAAHVSGVWRSLPTRARADVLRKASDLIEANAEFFAQTETKNTGKPIKESRYIDIAATIDSMRYYASICDALDGSAIPVGDGVIDFTRREPIGVVALITPWNFPIVLAMRKLAPALLAGNTIVLKPASLTPLTALLLGDVFSQAGLPKGVLNIVTGSGSLVGDALTSHRAVQKISFTGSVDVGATLMSKCAADVKGSCMELGGKSPAVVCADADLDKAAHGILFGAFLNQGECCCAATRVIVDASIRDRFVTKLVTLAKEKLIVGDPMSDAATMGPMICASHRAEVTAHIDRAIAQGAKILYRGELAKDLHRAGHWLAPIIIEATPTMDVFRKEVFGPVLTVTAVDGFDALMAAANDTDFGLAASVFTESMAVAERAIRALHAGTVWVNVHNFVFSAAPYGGVRHSGIGRECGVEGLLAYTHTKNVIVYAGETAFQWYA
jgi:aldehyde dehydrogenase (NAD+)